MVCSDFQFISAEFDIAVHSHVIAVIENLYILVHENATLINAKFGDAKFGDKFVITMFFLFIYRCIFIVID